MTARPGLPLDPDPRVPDGWLEVPTAEPVRRSISRAVIAALLLGLILGFAVRDALAASRPSSVIPAGPQAGVSEPDQTRTEASLVPLDASPSPSPTAMPRASSTDAPSSVSESGNARVGLASWYATGGPGEYAAMPEYRGLPFTVVVCAFTGGRANCLTLLVVDRCGCYVGSDHERAIDLSKAAFEKLAPLSVGLIRVTVTRL